MTTWTVSATVEADTAEQAVALAREGNMLAKRKARKEPKPFEPKAWKPGFTFNRKGVTYQVWSDAPAIGWVWAVQTDSPDHAPLVMKCTNSRSFDRECNTDGTEWKPQHASVRAS